MTENLDEKILEEKETEYQQRYNEAMKTFRNKKCSFNQVDFKSCPIIFIKILSIEKDAASNPASVIRAQMQKVLMAMWTVNMHFSMVIHHQGSQINLYVGSMCCGSSFNTVDSELRDIFAGSIPGIEFEKNEVTQEIKLYSFGEICGYFKDKPIGFFVGNPVVCDYTENGKNVSPIDEIISGTDGSDWILCITAQAIPKCEITDIRTGWYNTLADSKRYANVSFSHNIVGINRSMSLQEMFPGTQLYSDFSKKNCDELDEAMQCGQWRVGVFCASSSIARRDIFGGMFSAHMNSGTEQIQRPFPFEYRQNENVCFNYAIQYPSETCSTNITTRELAALSALPVRDTCGFNVAERIEFDVYRKDNGNLCLGKIVSGRNITSVDYRLNLDSLNRHGLIIGLTGGGKTNTVKSLLHSFRDMNCPFMVIEPAKKEYYEIYNMGITDLKIYSVGSADGTPLMINPFEVPQAEGRRVSLQSHIDAVFAAFKASFIMYTPMPYVLENAIYAIYRDYGWDPETDVNRFGRTEFPTIEDLYYKIGPIVWEMGYDQKMQNDLIGSLKARINSLRVGAKGRTLNVAKSINMENLLEGNTVIELDDVNDEDAKAFIISLLLLQMQECRKVQSTTQQSVRHILLIEEAHRLLKNVSSGTGEGADPRGNAVEFFCNMLAELRSKGQGFLVIDQSPAKLAPDLIKNTNLKIIHRTVAGEDRNLVGCAMNMTEKQMEYLSCLKQGYAAVYSEGDNHPKIVKLPYVGQYEAQGSQLSRNEILERTSRNCIQGNDKDAGFLNQNNTNPICRYCRKCRNWTSPESTLADSKRALDEIQKSYKNSLTETIHMIYELDCFRGYELCALASWFSGNKSGSMNYDKYSKSLKSVINWLNRIKERSEESV